MADDEGDRAQPSGVGRRALIGGAIGAAAAGIVGYEVGAASADDGGTAAAATEASAVRVEPTGELLADDVQGALTDVYDRTSALARLHDLQVAHELLDDFGRRAGSDGIGALDWAAVTAGAGAAATSLAAEGGVVQLTTGTTATGRAAIHLGLDQHEGAPVFTMEWRARVDQLATAGQEFSFALGAMASVDDSPSAGGPGMWVVYDAARSGTWWCRCADGKGVTEVDTKRKANALFRRFTITSDGTGLVRFAFDDEPVASIGKNVPAASDRYGQAAVIAKAAGTTAATSSIDWFYLRRELPR